MSWKPPSGAAELLALADVAQGGLVGAGLQAGRRSRRRPSASAAGVRATSATSRSRCEARRIRARAPPSSRDDAAFCIDAQRHLAGDRRRIVTPGLSGGTRNALTCAVGDVPREDGDHVGRRGAADPALHAVDHPVAVAATLGRRRQAAGDVRAVVGLGQREDTGQIEGARPADPARAACSVGAARAHGRAEEPGLARCSGLRSIRPCGPARSCETRRTSCSRAASRCPRRPRGT